MNEKTENAIGSGMAAMEEFSSARVQERLFRESIDKAIRELQAAAERGDKANALKMEMLARNARDPAVQDALRKSFADLQRQIQESMAAARNSLDEKTALKAILNDLGKLAGAGGIAFSAYQINEAVESGDSKRIGEALTGLLVGAVAAEVGAVIGATISSLALAPLIGAGAAVYIASQLIKGIFPEFEQWLGELTQEWRDELADLFEKMFSDPGRDEMNSRFSSATTSIAPPRLPPVDPLVLDLDGDGIASVPLGQDGGVRFDHAGNGIATPGGWIGPDDGFLVVDRNGNGVIDDGTELFGESSALENGLQPVDGFAALEAYDSNGDGIVDASDARFGELNIWRDRNQDGISQPDELMGLAEAGVAALETARMRVDINLGDGNSILFQGRYIGTDGYAREMADVLLAQDTYRSEFRDTLEIPDDILALPDAVGSGRVRNLREAASLSSTLKAALENYRSQTSVSGQKALLNDLLRKWAETSGYDPATVRFLDKTYHLSYVYAPGSNFSDAELAAMQSVVERFTGRPLFDIHAWIENPRRFFNVSSTTDGTDVYLRIEIGSNTLSQIIGAYDALADGVFETLFVQTLGAPMVNALTLAYRDGRLGLDFSDMEAEMTALVDRDRKEGFTTLLEFVERKAGFLENQGWVNSTFMGNLLKTHGLSDIANEYGYGFIDESGVFHGSPLSRVLFGSKGSDTLIDDQGDRILVGGLGDDVLDGGPGTDTYVFNVGDGNDRLFLRDFPERLVFGDGVSRKDIEFRVEGSNVIVRYSQADEILLDTSYLTPGTGTDVVLEFYDDTSMRLSLTYPYDGNNVGIDTLDVLGGDRNDLVFGEYQVDRVLRLSGGDGDDRIVSGATGDILEGGNGNDTLIGGPGDDFLDGGPGSDTYVFGHGDGHDWISEYMVLPGGRLSENDIARGIDRYPDTELGNNAIRFASGVAPEDVSLTFAPLGQLLFNLNGGRDSLSISDSDWGAIGRVTFEDYPDVVWYQEDLFRMALSNPDVGSHLYGSFGDDLIVGSEGTDWIDARYGFDIIKGMGGDDWLDGSTGFTHVEGGNGNDRIRSVLNGNRASVMVVDPGPGDDSIELVAGVTTYVRFDRGYGEDRITNSFDSELVIVMGDGIHPDEILVSSQIRSTSDYILALENTDDSLEIIGGEQIKEIQFGDGTVWTIDDLVSRDLYSETNRLTGATITENNTDWSMNGFAGNDILLGTQANDEMFGNEGDDFLDGGAGNDWLRGGPGADTYFFEAGDGADYIAEDRRMEHFGGQSRPDVIEFGDTVSSADILVSFQKTGALEKNLLLSNPSTGDTVTVANWFDSDFMDGTLEVRFADGTVWSTQDLRTMAAVDRATDDNDFLVGTERVDIVSGRSGDDTARTLAGDDHLHGGKGDDRLEGGIGNDTYYYAAGDGNDVIVDDGGDSDSIAFGVGIDPQDVTITENGNDLEIHISGTGDTLTIQDQLARSASRIESLTFFTDGSSMNLVANPSGDILLSDSNPDFYGTNYDDIVRGTAGRNLIRGGIGNDRLFGRGGRDRLMGDEGDDFLDGGPGDDEMWGGNGTNTFFFDAGYGNDTIHDPGDDSIVQLGPGINPANIRLYVISNVDLQIGIESNADDRLTLSGWFGGYGHTGSPGIIRFDDGTEWGIEEIEAHIARSGTPGDDILVGRLDDSDITLDGGDGNDRIYGKAGNDVLIGGKGTDILYGGAGDDELHPGVTGGDELHGGEGADNYVFGHEFGQVSIYEHLTDTSSNRITFTSEVSPDDIYVFVTNPNFAGTLDVGDLYIQVKNTDNWITVHGWKLGLDERLIDRIVFESDGTVWDTADIENRARFNLANLDDLPGENLDTGPFHAPNIIGERDLEQGESIEGTSGNDIIDAGRGDDIVYGFDGDDRLIGGAGDDWIYASAGEDYIEGGRGNDLLVGGIGADTYYIDLDSGVDRIIDFDTVPGRVDRILFADEILATDLEFTRDENNLHIDIGNDRAFLTLPWYVHPGYRLEAFVIGGKQYGLDAFDVPAGAPVTVDGTASGDFLLGSNGDDLLRGHEGDDLLNGGPGADRMEGGPGDDVYHVDDPGDRVTEKAGEGIDQVVSSIDYTLDGNIENLSFTGDAPHLGYGNALANVIKAGDGALTAYGGDGDDTFYGGSGSLGWDLFHGEKGNDTVRLGGRNGAAFGGAGDDRLHGGSAGWSYLSGDAGDDLLQAGTGYAYMAGGDGQDTLIGGPAGDYLHGGAGADSMRGGPGDDFYVVDDPGDLVFENAGEGRDRVQSSIDHILGADIEELVLMGSRTLRGNGNALDNLLIANNRGNAFLYGHDGNDIIRSGSMTAVGSPDAWDYFYGGNGADRLTLGARHGVAFGDAGNDILEGGTGQGFLFGGDGSDTLTGSSGALYLNGGAGDDILVSGAGNDTLLGAQGNDVYRFGRGDGADMLFDYDYQDAAVTNGATTDVLRFESGIDHDQLWFSRVGEDLKVNVIGTADSVRIVDWYLGPAYRLDHIDAGDGLRLHADQVDRLVQAMAAFSPPAAGELDLSPPLQTALAPTLAASWREVA